MSKVEQPNKQLLAPGAVVAAVDQLRPEVLLTLGAGDIDLLRAPLRNYFENRM